MIQFIYFFEYWFLIIPFDLCVDSSDEDGIQQGEESSDDQWEDDGVEEQEHEEDGMDVSENGNSDMESDDDDDDEEDESESEWFHKENKLSFLFGIKQQKKITNTKPFRTIFPKIRDFYENARETNGFST